jgi:phosphoribosylanthranilate isomerase
MMQVKICGITNIEDALCAAECGAAAAGFIFYPPSVRYIKPQKAREIMDKLPRELVKVGVFVNATAVEVKRIYDYCGLDMLQLHGDESPDYCRQFPSVCLIKALELKNEEDVRAAFRYDVAAILADSRHAGLYGGTGKTSNWELAGRISQGLILSGGLNEDNVRKALQAVNPAALDINSGVEERPGKKDSAKIARIMQVIKTADASGERPLIFIKRKET